jgi:RHS repeat-associated protein
LKRIFSPGSLLRLDKIWDGLFALREASAEAAHRVADLFGRAAPPGRRPVALELEGLEARVVPSTYVSFPITNSSNTSTWFASEGGAPATVYVLRGGSLSGAISVPYQTWDGTAIAGTNYVATSGSLAFADGQGLASIKVPLIDRGLTSGSEALTLSLGCSFGVTLGSPSTATITIYNDDPPPVASCGCGGGLIATGAQQGTGDPRMQEVSAATGVRYFDGTAWLGQAALSLPGAEAPFGQTLALSNDGGFGAGENNGFGANVAQLPFLLAVSGSNPGSVMVVSGDTARYFDLVNGAYQERFAYLDQLSYNATNDKYTLTDPTGAQLAFAGYTQWSLLQGGKLLSYSDSTGGTTSVTSWTAAGQPAEVQHSYVMNSTSVTDSYLYTYLGGVLNAGLVSNLTLRRQVNSGGWTVVRQAAYTYYGLNDPNGNAGDLQFAAVEDGAGNALGTSYYRYYRDGDTNGYARGVKYAFGPASYNRLAAAVNNPATASDSQVAPYADDYLWYDGQRRVTQAVVQGAGSSTATPVGLGTYTYSYTASGNTPGDNAWAVKTVETRPDGSTNTVYTNAYGEVMLDAFNDPASGLTWDSANQYDGAGRISLAAAPSAVTSYSEAQPGLVTLNAGSGLLTTYDYYASTTATETAAGGIAGYQQDVKIQQGQNGTSILQETWQYFAHAVNGTTVAAPANDTVYRNTDGTGGETTSYGYVWYSGTAQAQSLTVTQPVVSAGENGPGAADTSTTFFDVFGDATWAKDGNGYLTYTAYDAATDAVTETITDVNTNNPSDFTGLPSGWSTPAGGGLNLVMTYQVDALGRPTKETDPNGNVTYTVYLDAQFAVRVYPGWNSSTNSPTGPTQVTRYDPTGGYTETLTMTAAPHLTNGAPDGSEAISGLQTLARDYTNSAGQVVNEDRYFNLNGLTYSTAADIGTLNTNYYRSSYGYDGDGRLAHVQAPTGTITDTVYDNEGRVSSVSVGTNDTSPNNMVEVQADQYDGGGVGDGNLTQQTVYPGGSAANEVTQFWYDWRDRLVADKQGVQTNEDTTTHRPIVYYSYDNLDEVTAEQQYDGDGVTLTVSGGVPQPPSASLLRAQTKTLYDEQGRPYQTQVFDVNPSTGAVSSAALTTNTYYDHDDQVIAVSNPGGLWDKSLYDGAGRVIASYQTDGAGGTSWAAAGSVANDNVLEETDTQYDADGNPILVTSKQRFDSETATGALGNPTTGPKARVYYTAAYYDAANRLTAEVNVGTNGGTAYTRPSAVPTPSDTVLVTSYGYAGDAVQQVALTGSPTGGTFTLSFNGQTTSALAYNASAATVQAALQALSSIGSGNVFVAGGAGGPWTVRFGGALAGTSQAQLTANGAGLTGGTSPAVAVTTSQQGGDAGRVQQVTDPRGLVSKTDYDALGRTVRTIQDFTNGVPTASSDKTTEYTYDGDNNVLTVQADQPGGSYQQTQYVYGVTTTTGSTINSNDLLSAVRYPDKTTGQASSAAQETQTVNALGQPLTYTDRNGTVHTYAYDVLGRQVSDAVTTLGSGVDGSVRRIETAYNTQSLPYLYTSYDAASGGNVVNQVQRTYNGLGQLTGEYQAHAGAVNTSTTPEVQYAYTDMAGGANNSRLTSMTYPNGRALNYNYNAGLDSSISRLSSLSDSSGTLESYTYLGLATVVKRAHPLSGIDLTYIKQTGEANGDAGDQYTGLDRFGRVVDQRWLAESGGAVTDRFQYGYDRDGNVLYRANVVNAAFSELYGYDNLNQLTSFARGTLSNNNTTISNPSASESWGLDALGNMTSVTTNGTPQGRTYNQQNEVTGVGSANLLFDNNGNLTKDQNGNTLVYDAWGRLVQVKNSSNAVIASYNYDALGRRIVETESGTTTDLYYSSQWQVLEERVGGAATAQNVWSPVYVDVLVERDRSVNGGTLNERLWVQQDADYNVTALVNGSGQVVERYLYDPYGQVTVLNASWNPLSGSAYAWRFLFQGYRYDWTTSLYYARNRDYSPTLGRWTRVDPKRFAAGDENFYRLKGGSPAAGLDPNGTDLLPATFDPAQGPLQQGGVQLPPGALGGEPPAIGGWSGAVGVSDDYPALPGTSLLPEILPPWLYSPPVYSPSADLWYPSLSALNEPLPSSALEPYPEPVNVGELILGLFHGVPPPERFPPGTILLRPVQLVPTPVQAVNGLLNPVRMIADTGRLGAAGLNNLFGGTPYDPGYTSPLFQWAYQQRGPTSWNTILQAEARFLPSTTLEVLPWYAAFSASRSGRIGNCFPPDTLVGTELGLRPIAQIQPGERTWAYDFWTSQWRLCKIKERIERAYTGSIVVIRLAEGDIEATADHPFWVVQGHDLMHRPKPAHVEVEEAGNRETLGRWVDAKDIQIGDILLSRSGSLTTVLGHSMQEKTLTVYNLHVAELNTYSVGICQVLVHNRKTDIRQIREIGRSNGWDARTTKHFGDFVEDLKESGFWDGVGRHDTLSWEQLQEAAGAFRECWDLP